MISQIAALPEVSFIDNKTLDGVQADMVSDYEKKYEELTGKDAYDQPDCFPNARAEIEAEIPLGEGINYPYSTEEAAETCCTLRSVLPPSAPSCSYCPGAGQS